jgi:hypothetical protein
VDKSASRQNVHGLNPDLLIGGSTLDMQAKSNLYPKQPGAACLACFNAKEQDGEKLRALESRVRELPYEERREFLEQNCLDVNAVEEYLSSPRCGSLGEATLRDFATRPSPEFSVGFVSLGAGLLVAATLLRNSIFQGTAPPQDSMTSFNFLNGGMLAVALGADETCEQKCQSKFSTR